MAHKTKIIYVESPFVLRWFRLDLADVYSFQDFVRNYFSCFPEEKKQSLLNLYNALSHPRNPRNLKLHEE